MTISTQTSVPLQNPTAMNMRITMMMMMMKTRIITIQIEIMMTLTLMMIMTLTLMIKKTTFMAATADTLWRMTGSSTPSRFSTTPATIYFVSTTRTLTTRCSIIRGLIGRSAQIRIHPQRTRHGEAAGGKEVEGSWRKGREGWSTGGRYVRDEDVGRWENEKYSRSGRENSIHDYNDAFRQLLRRAGCL